jgi:hypothetical protein
VRPGWCELVNLFTVVALPPGDRKSTVFRDALAPVREFEQAEQARLNSVIVEMLSVRR